MIKFSILPKQFLNFHLFRLKYFYTYFNEVYAMYKIIYPENKTLNRNARNAVRKSLLWNTCWLWIKTFTNQTSTFSIFYKYIFMLIKQNKNSSSSISHYYLLNSYLIFLFCFSKESLTCPKHLFHLGVEMFADPLSMHCSAYTSRVAHLQHGYFSE